MAMRYSYIRFEMIANSYTVELCPRWAADETDSNNVLVIEDVDRMVVNDVRITPESGVHLKGEHGSLDAEVRVTDNPERPRDEHGKIVTVTTGDGCDHPTIGIEQL